MILSNRRVEEKGKDVMERISHLLLNDFTDPRTKRVQCGIIYW